MYYVKNIMSVIEGVKTECVGLVNLVDSLDHIYDKMPKLLEQYE